MHQHTHAVLVIADPILSPSLEAALLAGGFAIRTHPSPAEPGALPVSGVAAIVADARLLQPDAVTFSAALRATDWDGAILLITGDNTQLQPHASAIERLSILEMPFGSGALISALRDAGLA